MKKKNNIFTRIKAKTFETLLILKLTKEYCRSMIVDCTTAPKKMN